MGLQKGMKVSFEVKENEVRIKKLPSSLDWADLIKKIPVENVEIDDNGHYDPKKHLIFMIGCLMGNASRL